MGPASKKRNGYRGRKGRTAGRAGAGGGDRDRDRKTEEKDGRGEALAKDERQMQRQMQHRNVAQEQEGDTARTRWWKQKEGMDDEATTSRKDGKRKANEEDKQSLTPSPLVFAPWAARRGIVVEWNINEGE